MQTMVPLYGFGGGGGTGAVLTVNAPAGCTVTITKDGKTKTKVAGDDGVVVFKGLSTGDWTCNMTSADGTQTMTPVVYHITADYETTLAFFAATIHVTYPAGSTCTATDGVTTLTAPDTSGTWECVVPNTGTWDVTSTDGSNTVSQQVSITEDGQSGSVTLMYDLYNYGKQNYIWTAEAVLQSSSVNGFVPVITENEDGSVSVKLTRSSAGMVSGGYISEPVDLSSADTLFIDFEEQKTVAAKSNSSYFIVMPVDYVSVDDSHLAMVALTGKESPVSLDVSGISGMCRVLVQEYINTYSNGTGYVDITVKRVWGSDYDNLH